MKNKKIILLFMLLIVVVLALTLVACQPTDNPNNGGDDDDSFGKPTKSLIYELNDQGTGYRVRSISQDDCPTEIVIASMHNKLPVVGISDWAFKNNTVIESVKIPGNVTFIGGSAFEGCVNLKSVTIAKNSKLKTIYGYSYGGCLGAFSYCTSLENINLPEGLTDIEGGAFSNCTSLKNIVIPDGTTSIGRDAFSGCTNLESIVLPDSLTEIGEEVFDQCEKLQTLTIPKNVTTVSNLFSYHFPGNLVTLNWNAVNATISLEEYEDAFSPDTLTTVNIGDDVEVLPEKFLNSYRNLTTVNFGANSKLKTIGSGAFNWCTSLTNVTLPESLTEIESIAFNYCTSLTNVTLPDSLTKIGYRAFAYCENAFTELTIGKNVTVEENAFSGCSSITKVTASYVVASEIAISCDSTELDLVITDFENAEGDWKTMTNVKTVTIADSVTAICDSAFSGCERLVSVTFGENSKLESIGSSAFEGCTALTNVTLPDSLTEINSYAFSGCENAFTELTFGENASVSDSAFSNCKSITKITASAEVASNVGIACNSAEFEVVITSGDTIEPFSKYGGSKYVGANLRSITIPKSVTAISQIAFAGCAQLEDVIMEDGTAFSIGSQAFDNCSSLTNKSLQDIVNCATEIGARAFVNITCDELIIPDDGAQPVQYAWPQFSACTITKLTCSAGWANRIVRSKYTTCDELVVTSGTYICIPQANIKKITLPDTLIELGDDAFWECNNLVEITIPEGVTTIGEGAFQYCDKLTTINLPSTITEIGRNMFYSSWSVSTINYNGTKADWKKINKHDGWYGSVSQSFNVYCTNGYLKNGI